MLDNVSAAGMSSDVQKFMGQPIPNHDAQGIVDKFAYQIPVIMSHPNIGPLAYNQSEKCKMLQLLAEFVIREEQCKPRQITLL